MTNHPNSSVNADSAKLVDEIFQKRGYIYPWQRFVAENDPEFLARYENLWDEIFEDEGVIDGRVKQLILIGVVASKQDDTAIHTQITRGLRIGLSPQEILAALEVAFVPGGALTLVHGVKGLVDALEERKD